MKSTIIDRIVNYFDPSAGLKRIRSRKQAEILQSVTRKYEGAGISRRTENWNTQNTDANTEVRDSISKLRSRSRDLVRNNAFAERAAAVLESNIVGKGIVTQFYSSNTSRESEINRLWNLWTDSIDCDWSSQMTWPMMQRMIIRMIVESGESLCRLHFMDSRSKTDVPLTLELLEPDFIASENYVLPKTKTSNTIVDGIEIDARGRKIAFHLYKAHPGATNVFSMAARLKPSGLMASICSMLIESTELVNCAAFQSLHL
jgi:capsid protein